MALHSGGTGLGNATLVEASSPNMPTTDAAPQAADAQLKSPSDGMFKPGWQARLLFGYDSLFEGRQYVDRELHGQAFCLHHVCAYPDKTSCHWAAFHGDSATRHAALLLISEARVLFSWHDPEHGLVNAVRSI